MRKLPTHCVLMVTYNQEEFIQTALDSIFDNEVLPDKVIICDDCSFDGTWNVISDFKLRYNDIIDCYRNEKNLGLFQNFNQVFSFGIKSGCDIISVCSGDDYLKKGVFKELNKVVSDNQIDVTNDKFVIVTNTEELYPDGYVKLVDNYSLRNEKDLMYYRLSGKLSYREVGLSRNILKNIAPYRYDLGVWADLLFCLDYENNCDKFYFTPFVSSGYRVGVGTVSKQNMDAVSQSRYNVEKEVLRTYKLSKKSRKYLNRHVSEYEFKNEFNKYKSGERKNFPFALYIKTYGVFAMFTKTIKFCAKKLLRIK